MFEIFAGDYYATKEPKVVLSTLLGSCISVCLKDKRTGVVGINHFMLPATVRIDQIIFNEDARYGIHAMELLINSMLKIGARKQNLEAKVFGGGKVLDTTLSNVAQSNIDFVFAYLTMESIPVLASDVGGQTGRKILFLPDSFTVYLRRIQTAKTMETAVGAEKKLLQSIQKKRSEDSDLVLFS